MKKNYKNKKSRNKIILTYMDYILLIALFAVVVLGIKNILLIVDAINNIKIV